MTSQVEVPPLTGLIHFFSGKRKVKIDICHNIYVKYYNCINMRSIDLICVSAEAPDGRRPICTSMQFLTRH